MDLYPAIDIRDGVAVRLAQGDFGRERGYGDPVALASRFASAGAPWLHVVDLDAARSGRPVNRAAVLAIARGVAVPVQAGGGVRSLEDAAELLGGGVRRVVLGTAALERQGLAEEVARAFPGRVAVGLDYRAGRDGRELAVRGWERETGRGITDVLAELAGAPLAAVVVTAIERDGMLSGPDLEGSAELLGVTSFPLVVSGGVSSARDIEALAGLAVAAGDGGGLRRVSGVISGKALVEGWLSVEEGVEACARSG